MPKLAISAQERTQLGALSASEGIYVDRKSFGVVRGTAKTDPAAQIMKLGAQEVKEGAIIIRAGDKLYLVDADPDAKSLFDWLGGCRHRAETSRDKAEGYGNVCAVALVLKEGQCDGPNT